MSVLSRHARRGFVAAALAAGLVSLAGCAAGASSEPAETAAAGVPAITEGKLTVATGEPAFSPWVLDDDPASGKGFESAVIYAVADELGFAQEDVVWVRSTFDSAIAPGAKDWDLNIQQFSANEDRAKAVDFSSPYYVTAQAVITTGASKAAGVSSIADLKTLVVGAMTGTTSHTIAEKELGTQIQAFNNNTDATQALTSGQIDALVVDLPTAFYITAAELEDGKIVGQFADTSGGDNLAIVLPKDSSLTADVTAALDTLRDNGELQKITDEWLSSEVAVPVLK